MSAAPSINSDQDAVLYGQDLIIFAARIDLANRLHNPDITVEQRSRTCGSRLVLDINITSDGRIRDLGHDLQACVLARAVLAVFTERAVGLNRSEISNIRRHFKNWLDGHVNDLPDGWQTLDILGPARDYTPRHPSMLLPFDAALDALKT